jgi:hypothetical protein
MEESDQLVEHSYPGRCRNQHAKDKSLAFQAVRFGRGDQINSGKDDVRHEAKAARTAKFRRAPKARKVKIIHVKPSRNGFLAMQV